MRDLGGFEMLCWLFSKKHGKCPRCNWPVTHKDIKCENCGQPLDWVRFKK